MRHRNVLPLLARAMAFCCIAATAGADSVVPPYAYAKGSRHGRFIFVMIPPVAVAAEGEPTESRRVRETYAKSGLYRAGDPSTPLWTVDWYAYGVDVASDGVHLVRHGPWASHRDQEAFSFFANGRLIRTYAISELVDSESLLPRSVSHFEWSKHARFDDAALRYHVSTFDGNSFVFDISNGLVVQETRRARFQRRAAVAAVAAAGVGAVVLIVFALHRRRRRVAARGAAA